MKTAIIFPGQGSQFVGMGRDFYNKYQSSKKIFDDLDILLDRDIKNLTFSGDIAELSQTENSQPTIMATSIAIFNALKDEKLITKDSYHAVAGHSLGEYSALVANNGITFEQSVQLLKIRSRAMQDSMPLGTSGMLALIGCNSNVIKSVIENASKFGQIYIANDNAEGQIVLSGEINAIEYILSNKKKLAIRKAVQLPVSASFHCSLMSHASKKLGKEINNVNFNNFDVPLYSNVTSMPCSEKEIGDLLIRQVTSKVRWREIIENMILDEFHRFIEIGPGNVLTNLVKRISKEVKAISISKLSDLDNLSNVII